MSKVGELDRDIMDCGGPQETWQEMVRHLKWRAANSRGLSRDAEKSAKDMAEDAEYFAEQATEFDALADALGRANITFPAIVDTHRMAETENTGSVRSMSGDGAGTAIAQPPEQP